MEVSGQLHILTALLPEEKVPGIQWIKGWVGHRASLDMVAKRKNPFPAPAGNQTLVMQPIA
jgi:hypothetical protein